MYNILYWYAVVPSYSGSCLYTYRLKRGGDEVVSTKK